MIFLRLLFFFLCILTGCQQGALYVYQQKIEPTYLASANIGSPDPRAPPRGQMIVAEWWVPQKLLAYDPSLRIHIIFQDFTQTCVEYPIRTRIGYETYSVLNKDFNRTKGLLAYKGEIVTCDGEVFTEWKHQLWVKLITDTDEMSSAVVEKSKQGSVIETPGCNSPS